MTIRGTIFEITRSNIVITATRDYAFGSNIDDCGESIVTITINKFRLLCVALFKRTLGLVRPDLSPTWLLGQVLWQSELAFAHSMLLMSSLFHLFNLLGNIHLDSDHCN